MAVAYTVIGVGKCGGIFSFFQLCKLQEAVLCKRIILFVESNISQIIICQCISLRIPVRSQVQIFVKVTGSFLHPVQAIIRFTSPIDGIRFGLQVVLPQSDRLVEITDSFLELCICKRLGAEVEQDFLFSLQNGSTRMGDTFDGFQSSFITAGIHIHLYQITADFIHILGIGEFIEELFENGDRFTESGIRSFVNTEGIVVCGLLLDLHVCIRGGSLFKCHTRFVLVSHLQVRQAHVQIGIL